MFMAILRVKEIRDMDDNTLKGKYDDLKKELVKLNTNSRVSGKNINTGHIKELRRTIARMLTVLRERGAM
jgi:large subunit ribosomal protein L29